MISNRFDSGASGCQRVIPTLILFACDSRMAAYRRIFVPAHACERHKMPNLGQLAEAR